MPLPDFFTWLEANGPYNVPPQQVPGYAQASPEGQAFISNHQNSMNWASQGLSDPLMQQTMQRMRMTPSQAAADIKSQAQQQHMQANQGIQQQTQQYAQQRNFPQMMQRLLQMPGLPPDIREYLTSLTSSGTPAPTT